MGSPTPFLAGPVHLNPETRTDPPRMCPSKSKRELKAGLRGYRTRLEAGGGVGRGTPLQGGSPSTFYKRHCPQDPGRRTWGPFGWRQSCSLFCPASQRGRGHKPGVCGAAAKSNPNKVRLEWNCKYLVLLAQVAATLRARGAESKGSAADALVGETRGLEPPRCSRRPGKASCGSSGSGPRSSFPRAPQADPAIPL